MYNLRYIYKDLKLHKIILNFLKFTWAVMKLFAVLEHTPKHYEVTTKVLNLFRNVL